MSDTAQAPAPPYEVIGGRPVVQRLVDRFYDLMDKDPAYLALRQIHAVDLAPMRQSLTSFLCAWLGGPRDWFEANPGRCVMSAHAPIPITAQTAAQWMAAMGQALDETGIEPDLKAQIRAAFGRMSAGMVR